ncbi:MAG: hypothetical protein RL088_2334 [Verrucomicrobiota bacterium]
MTHPQSAPRLCQSVLRQSRLLLGAALILFSGTASVFSQPSQKLPDARSIKASIEAAESEQTIEAFEKAATALKSYQPDSLEEKRERLALSAKFMAVLARRIEADSRRPVKKPAANVALPPGVSGVAGMSPESISDPALRNEYEAAIAENRRNAQFWTEFHRRERMLRGMISPFVSDSLVAYRDAEDMEKRLASLLTAEGVPAPTITTVLDRYRSIAARLNPTLKKTVPTEK